MKLHTLRPALALLAALICGPAMAQDSGGDAANGEVLAQTHCGACHAIGTTGTSRDPNAPPFRELASRYDVEDLQEALGEGISVGHKGAAMPEFAFEPNEVSDIIAYLKRVGGDRKPK